MTAILEGDSKKFATSNSANIKFVNMEKIKDIKINIPKIKECKLTSTINNPEAPCIIP